jgi:ribonucleoside-triphosphate reductase (thioredoxin)
MTRDQLVEAYKDFIVPWGPIGEPVFRRSYSHSLENGKKENWIEAGSRTIFGNLGLVDEKHVEPDEAEKLAALLFPFGIIPAGRHLYASGVKGRQFLFNCHASGWDPKEPDAHFTFLFDALMQGGGVGSNYSNRYMQEMPEVRNRIDLHVKCHVSHPNIGEFEELLSEHHSDRPVVYINVEDSREGWVDSVGQILRYAYDQSGNPEEFCVVYDVSNIRERGAPLKTSGGIACGPGPLVTMIVDFVRHLNGCVGRKLRSLDAMVLDHTLASCVVAGGKRRSSRISVKSWHDPDIFEFINCKREDGSHWSTNISVETDDDFDAAYAGDPRIGNFLWDQARDVARAVTLASRLNGEPGFWNRSLSMKGEREPGEMYCPNPCGEIAMQMWENCNLGHINLQYFAKKPLAELKEAFRLMTRWLIRATYGDIPNARQRAVVDKNRRIGVGFFGFHGWLGLRGIKYSECFTNEYVLRVLKECREVVDTEAVKYSAEIGIPSPVKTTTLAPTGTIACMPGATTGAQALFARRFKRRVRYSDMDQELAVKKLEMFPVYPDLDARNTSIVEYWCEDPLVAHVRAAGWDPDEILEDQEDVPMETALKVQAMLQEVWANNAISYTINLKAETMPSEEEMELLLMKYHPYIKGTTIFPEVSRRNPPLERITKEQFDAYTGPKQVTQVEVECVGGCPIK